jgi:hypothetical protein
MTGPTPFFGSSCWPGARSTASMVEATPGHPALSIYLDPMEWLVHVPPFPDGDRYMVRFLRQLARVAGDMADELDPDADGADQARHRLTEAADSVWFGIEQAGSS